MSLPSFSVANYTSATTPRQPQPQFTPGICSSKNFAGLHDNEINVAVNIITSMFPDAPPLQATSLGIYCPNETMPMFKPAPGKFVQIFYLPDHWVVVTNMFS
jgi:hypothetical protein